MKKIKINSGIWIFVFIILFSQTSNATIEQGLSQCTEDRCIINIAVQNQNKTICNAVENPELVKRCFRLVVALSGEEVKEEVERDKGGFLWFLSGIVLIAIIAVAISFYYYQKLKQKQESIPVLPAKIIEKPNAYEIRIPKPALRPLIRAGVRKEGRRRLKETEEKRKRLFSAFEEKLENIEKEGYKNPIIVKPKLLKKALKPALKKEAFEKAVKPLKKEHIFEKLVELSKTKAKKEDIFAKLHKILPKIKEKDIFAKLPKTKKNVIEELEKLTKAKASKKDVIEALRKISG